MRYPQQHLSNAAGAFAGLLMILTAMPAVAASPAPIPSHCRNFSEMVTIDGERQPVHGMVCRRRNGTWQVVPPPIRKMLLNSPYAPATEESAGSAGGSNAAGYFWSPTELSFPQYCNAQAPTGVELGWPGFYPSGNSFSINRIFNTTIIGFPLGPTVIDIAPPSVAIVNPHGGHH